MVGSLFNTGEERWQGDNEEGENRKEKVRICNVAQYCAIEKKSERGGSQE